MSQDKHGKAASAGAAMARLVAGALLAVTAAGCVALPGESGIASDDQTASASVASSASPESSPALSPTMPAASPSTGPTVSPTAVATESPTAAPTPGPSASAASSVSLPVLPVAASGPWKGIRWFAASVPALSADRTGNLDIYGWSGGYLAFTSISPDPSTVATDRPAIDVLRSKDGIHWSGAAQLDVSGIGMGVRVAGLHEGPGGLLAEARAWGVTCGGTPKVEALWLSKDGGASWAAVSVPTAFAGGSALTLSGGSAGYIATGSVAGNEAGPAVWVSTDGRQWRQTNVPPAGAATEIDGAVAFSGGYVASGAVVGPEGCGGVQLLTTALWWSKDGTAWARDTVPGQLTAPTASMTVKRIDDGALLAIAYAYDPETNASTRAAWVSGDGRAWQKADWALGAEGEVIGDGRHAVVMSNPDEKGDFRIAELTGTSLVTLAESGTRPFGPNSSARLQALGPSGLLAADDAGHVWIGVPTAN